MNSWTTLADIKSQIRLEWDSGALLTAVDQIESRFPWRLRLKKPSSAELSEKFEEVRAWIAMLVSTAKTDDRLGYRIEWRVVNHRILGANTIPESLWIDSLDDALMLIDKRNEASVFLDILKRTRQRLPVLLSWLYRRPLWALALADDWERLLDVVIWTQVHPRPMVYLRQVDLPGIHSKFIENHRGVLTELFDLALAPQEVDESFSGTAGFARRYGFCDKPGLIRFRLLADDQLLLATGTDNDISVTSETFAKLDLKVSRVFITENEVNFLAFPKIPDALVVFGAGYGLEMLRTAQWLDARSVYYWGDIDTHGFAILDQLRARFAHAQSLLMDEKTLMAHQAQWTDEPQQCQRELHRLRPGELELYESLRRNQIANKVRLEQERIGFKWVQRALESLGNEDD